MNHPHGFEDLQSRLLKLEKQNRRSKQLGAVVLAVAAVIMVMGQAPSKRIIEANEFILKDASGNVRARLAMSDVVAGAIPEVVLLNEKGNTSVQIHGGIAAKNFGGGISVYDSRGQEREAFDVTEGGPVISVLDSKGNSRGVYGFAEADNSPFLSFFDLEENLRGAFSAKNYGSSLTFYDSKLTPRGSFTGGEEGAFLVLANSKGHGKTGLGEGSVGVSDDQGFESILGVHETVTPRTGETHKTSAAFV